MFARRIAVALTLFAAGPAPAADKLDPKVDEVIALTKANRDTYALYQWNSTVLKDARYETWGVEFNKGAKHRVETPYVRVIADCEAGTGKTLWLATGKITEGPEVARTACGIDTTKPFVSSAYEGPSDTPWGRAHKMRMTDATQARTYVVREDGVILAITIRENDPAAPLALTARTLAVETSLPSEDMFDEASLQQSFVPERYRKEPWPD